MGWFGVNWDAIGAVGEILGAVAVFMSLVYLGVQIRANTTSMNTASRQAVANEFRDWIRLVNEDNRVFAEVKLQKINFNLLFFPEYG